MAMLEGVMDGMIESHDVQVVGQPLLAVLLLPHHLQGGLHGREQGDQVRRKVRMLAAFVLDRLTNETNG